MNKKTYIASTCAGLSMYLNVMGNEDNFICDSYPSMGQAQFAYLNIIPLECKDLSGKTIHNIYLQQLVNKDGIWAISQYNTNFTKLIMNSDFKNKTSKEIFEKIFLNTNNYCGYIRAHFRSTTQECNISESDRKIAKRVISGDPKDKAILFIGFDQNQPTEGSEIYADTPGYTRSIFWSNWNDRPEQNHNAIKFCFCKINEFLKTNPQFYSFFDYIIIGCQTREYITPDTWIALGSMLKKEGRIIYREYGKTIDEYYGYPAFLNKMLREHCIEGKNFNLYKCGDETEPIYQEIKQLTSFNNEYYESSDVCYANAKTLYWHKKL